MSASTMDRLWSDYEEHHQNKGNRTCHMIGIPLIVFGLLSLLAIPVTRVGGWPIEISLLILLVVGAVDIWLDAKLGTLMLVSSLVLYLIARMLVLWQVAVGLFLIGWVFQFIGHGAYEKRAPAFYKNLAHLIIGPLWVLNHVFHVREEGAVLPASVRG